jgi:hypothetical protein
MGGAPVFFGHDVPLSTMIDSAPVLEVIAAIFQSESYQCTGYGGDFVMVTRSHTRLTAPLPGRPLASPWCTACCLEHCEIG